MKRASYRHAVEWIAMNDDDGSPDALVIDVVKNYVTSVLVADIFAVDPLRVGIDIIRLRKKLAKPKTSGHESCPKEKTLGELMAIVAFGPRN